MPTLTCRQIFFRMNLKNSRQGTNLSLKSGESTPKIDTKQILNEEIYSDLANQDAIKAEIGDVLAVIDNFVTDAVKEVNNKMSENPIKYSQRAMYATELNAIIKANILKKMAVEPNFNTKIKVKKNHGSIYFIVKDKYAVFIKKLTGKMNKPNCYPTTNSEKMFNGELFTGTPKHIPFLFIGPNILKGGLTYVTSLISRKEVYWTTECNNLFEVVELKTTQSQREPTEVSAAKLKQEKIIRSRKIN